MKKILLSFLIIFSSIIYGQTFKAKIISSKKYPWSILYQVKNIRQVYIDNKQPDSTGVLTYQMKGLTPGEYFLLYDMDHQKYFYFVYNNKDVELKVYPEKNNKIEITQSKENKIYLPFAGKRDLVVALMDDVEKKKINGTLQASDIAFFNKSRKNLDSLIQAYQKKSKGLLVENYIKNSGEYYPDIKLPKEKYFEEKLLHYFDNINLNNPELSGSKIILEKINKYVFNINPPSDPSKTTEEYKKRVNKILSLVNREELRNNLILYFIQSFVKTDGKVSKYLIENYYNKMPEKYQNLINIQSIIDDLGLLEGEQAPDFEFTDLKTKRRLSDIKGKYTVLIFWSATCPHCLRAMPKIQKFMKGKKDFTVVAIGLESDQADWMREHYFYPEYIHGVFINKKNKWNQDIIKKYHITETPTFFILDKNKKIIAKPYAVEDLEKTVNSLSK